MVSLKSAHDTLGPHPSLEGLVVGTRLVHPALRVVRQPHHAQFVIHAVPDDVAATFDCENQLELGEPPRARRQLFRKNRCILRRGQTPKSRQFAAHSERSQGTISGTMMGTTPVW
jgi:hypothetical protein